MCEFKSTTKSGLKRQKTIKHRTMIGIFKCDICETNCESKGDLKMHEELEHELDLDCEYCDFRCKEISCYIMMEVGMELSVINGTASL